MDYKRIIRFQYFQMFYTRKIGDTDSTKALFDFADWLLKMKNSGYVKKTISLDGILVRIDKIEYVSEHKLWFVRFMKLRDNNIPSKVKDNEEARVIELEDDEYIGEDMTVLYDTTGNIVMSQCNRFSLGLTRITELIKQTIKRNDIKIEFSPFLDINTDRLKNCDFRNIEVTFANLTHAPVDTMVKRPLREIIRNYKSMGAITGKVVYGLGHAKFNTLNSKETQELMYDLNEYKQYIRSAKVKVLDKNDENEEIETIDLFDNLVQDWIEFTLHSREPLKMDQVVKGMTARFLKKRGVLYEMAKIKIPKKTDEE